MHVARLCPRISSGLGFAAPVLLLLAGCGAKVVVDTGASGGGGAAAMAACQDPIAGLASAIAIPEAGGASLRVNISSSEATCADPLHVPGGCAAAWRVRLEIPPELQKPGTYTLDTSSAIFAYLDGQAPGSGSQCKNLGKDYAATLIISELDATHLVGALCGNADVHGTFVAQMCPSCKGAGDACTNDAECCNQLCSGVCQP